MAWRERILTVYYDSAFLPEASGQLTFKLIQALDYHEAQLVKGDHDETLPGSAAARARARLAWSSPSPSPSPSPSQSQCGHCRAALFALALTGANAAGSAARAATEGPYGGTAAAVPGTVYAENYDTGGQGVAYNVTSVNGTDKIGRAHV